MKQGSKRPATKSITVTEEKSIRYGGEEVFFFFTRKRVKNLNARVRADGSLSVSAPLRIPYKTVEEFLQKNLHRLLPAMKENAARRSRMPTGLQSGLVIPVFGQPHTLVLQKGKHLSVTFGDGCVILTHRESDGEETRRAVLARTLVSVAEKELALICRKIYDGFYEGAVSYPKLRYRKMVASWGNCRKKEGIITLNLRLLYAPRAAVEYVVVHEFAHLLRADHSLAFWQEVSCRMPDYRARRELLRTVSLRDDPFL